MPICSAQPGRGESCAVNFLAASILAAFIFAVPVLAVPVLTAPILAAAGEEAVNQFFGKLFKVSLRMVCQIHNKLGCPAAALPFVGFPFGVPHGALHLKIQRFVIQAAVFRVGEKLRVLPEKGEDVADKVICGAVFPRESRNGMQKRLSVLFGGAHDDSPILCFRSAKAGRMLPIGQIDNRFALCPRIAQRAVGAAPIVRDVGDDKLGAVHQIAVAVNDGKARRDVFEAGVEDFIAAGGLPVLLPGVWGWIRRDENQPHMGMRLSVCCAVCIGK